MKRKKKSKLYEALREQFINSFTFMLFLLYGVQLNYLVS